MSQIVFAILHDALTFRRRVQLQYSSQFNDIDINDMILYYKWTINGKR